MVYRLKVKVVVCWLVWNISVDGRMEEILQTPVDMVNFPIIQRVLYIPGGAGFLPSTEWYVIAAFACYPLLSLSLYHYINIIQYENPYTCIFLHQETTNTSKNKAFQCSSWSARIKIFHAEVRLPPPKTLWRHVQLGPVTRSKTWNGAARALFWDKYETMSFHVFDVILYEDVITKNFTQQMCVGGGLFN